MKKKQHISWIVGFSLLLLMAFTSCTTGRLLNSSQVAPAAMIGERFRLLIYGGQGTNDLKTVAILDKKGDAYRFEAFGGQYNSRVIDGLSRDKALEKARNAVGQLNSFLTEEIRAIKGPTGAVLGYEVRPLFIPSGFGRSDLLDTSYVLEPEKIITVYVEIKSNFNEPLFNDNGYQW